MYVKWGSTLSSKFQVTNGARQGDVLSPRLFNVDVNELRELLNNSGIGGNMGGTIINHMLYADDINKHCGLPVIYLGNCVCQFVREVKYLGVMIHSSMKTTIDVARQTRKLYMKANLLLRNFRYLFHKKLFRT